MFRRPVLTSLIVAWVVASAVTTGLVALEDRARMVLVDVLSDSATHTYPSAWFSSAAWLESTPWGWVAGGVAGGVCFVVMRSRSSSEPNRPTRDPARGPSK